MGKPEHAITALSTGHACHRQCAGRGLEHADLAIAEDQIVGVGRIPGGFVPDRTIDGRERIVLLGFINTHTHLSMTLMRNYADDLAFWPWLLERIKPLEDHLSPEDVRIGARLGIAELIRGGTTCFHDMYFHMDQVADEVATRDSCLSHRRVVRQLRTRRAATEERHRAAPTLARSSRRSRDRPPRPALRLPLQPGVPARDPR